MKLILEGKPLAWLLRQILHSTGLEFQHQVQEAKDLDQLIKIHYRYLATIHDRCLLREKVNDLQIFSPLVLVSQNDSLVPSGQFCEGGHHEGSQSGPYFL